MSHGRPGADAPRLRSSHGSGRIAQKRWHGPLAVDSLRAGLEDLEIVGVGYKAEVKGKTIVFSIGYSHHSKIDHTLTGDADFTLPLGVANVERCQVNSLDTDPFCETEMQTQLDR